MNAKVIPFPPDRIKRIIMPRGADVAKARAWLEKSLAEQARDKHSKRLADGVCQHNVNLNQRGCRKCEHGDEI